MSLASSAASAVRQPSVPALAIALVALLAVGGAWAFQGAGYTPCELCLLERIPYYVGIAVALVTAWLARRPGALSLAGYAALILIFVASAALGLYHAGVEFHLWPGPAQCSGAVTAAPNVEDFLQQLNHVAVTRCDEVALRLFGVSLAVWNVLISVVLIGVANLGLLRNVSGYTTRAARRGASKTTFAADPP